MLCLLRIQNFALIDCLELDWRSGLTVLTGETGAGKSIILDAIDLALGGKANSHMLRTGCDRTQVEATFTVTPDLQQWLIQQEIDLLDDGTVICSREITLNKGSIRSRNRVNGIVMNRQLMAELRQYLVEITAQGQTVELMIPERQRAMLDSYGGRVISQCLEQVSQDHQEFLEVHKTLEKRRTSEQERLQRLDLIEYQLQELHALNLNDPEELENLSQEHDRLAHVVELQQLSYQSNQILYQNDDGENPAVADLLGDAEALLKEMVNYDPQLESILEMVRNALTEVVEAGHQISAYGDNLEADPEHLGEVETRIRQLKQVCRKYGSPLQVAIAYRDQLQQELDDLTGSEQSIEELEIRCNLKKEKLVESCLALTELRQKAARKLEKQLIKELRPLAMEKVVFECRLTPTAPTATGADQVTFYFSPNPGEKAQPLSAIASGGEMSRFLLALKACFSHAKTSTQTLVFDEVDAGVSGKVAQAIATKLHQLSQHHQILCVTHQPLIAAMADAHLRVAKQIVEQSSKGQPKEQRTIVTVESLSQHQTRRDELAQLTGGHSAQEAISFAESLLTQAQAQKSKIA